MLKNVLLNYDINQLLKTFLSLVGKESLVEEIVGRKEKFRISLPLLKIRKTRYNQHEIRDLVGKVGDEMAGILALPTYVIPLSFINVSPAHFSPKYSIYSFPGRRNRVLMRSSTKLIDPTGSVSRQIDVQGLKRKLREATQKETLMSMRIYTLMRRMVSNGDEVVLEKAITDEPPSIHDFADRLRDVRSETKKKVEFRKFVPKDRKYASKPPTPSPKGKMKSMTFPLVMYQDLSDDEASAQSNTDGDEEVLDNLRATKKAKTFIPSDDEWIEDL